MEFAKAFEPIVTYAQSLNQWALLVVGGTALVILQQSHRRPERWTWRWVHFALVPGWLFEAVSVHYGGAIHRTYIAYLITRNPNQDEFMTKVNDLASRQIFFFYSGIIFFAVWLVLYLFWWVTAKRTEFGGDK